MDAMLVVDMQAGLLDGAPKHDLAGVVARIESLSRRIRERGGTVVRIRHCGPPGDPFARGADGWQFLPELPPRAGDIVVEKTLNDAFAGTDLAEVLRRLAPDRLLVAGWATDFCVDSTVRAAVSAGHAVMVAGDGHTLADRPHLDAATVIRHHNWVWSELIARTPVRVAPAHRILGAG